MVMIRDLSLIYELQVAYENNKILKMLTATVSHEMMQPLSNVIGIASSLTEIIKDNSQLELVKLIIIAGKLLRCQMRDLLDHNQLEYGSLAANFDFEDVVEISQEVVTLMQRQA